MYSFGTETRKYPVTFMQRATAIKFRREFEEKHNLKVTHLYKWNDRFGIWEKVEKI